MRQLCTKCRRTIAVAKWAKHVRRHDSHGHYRPIARMASR